jgi:NADH dehydrogenase FAD-containing subunit
LIGHLGFLNQVSNQISLQVAHFDPESLSYFNPDLVAHFNPESLAHFNPELVAHFNPEYPVDKANNKISTSIGEFPYDYLVIAIGCTTNFFGNENFKK